MSSVRQRLSCLDFRQVASTGERLRTKSDNFPRSSLDVLFSCDCTFVELSALLQLWPEQLPDRLLLTWWKKSKSCISKAAEMKAAVRSKVYFLRVNIFA